MDHLRRFGNGISVSIPADEHCLGSVAEKGEMTL